MSTLGCGELWLKSGCPCLGYFLVQNILSMLFGYKLIDDYYICQNLNIACFRMILVMKGRLICLLSLLLPNSGKMQK